MNERQLDTSAARVARPSVTTLIVRGTGGAAYLAIIALGLAEAAKTSYLVVLALVFVTVMVEFTLILVLVAGWASSQSAGPFQLRLSSVFLVLMIKELRPLLSFFYPSKNLPEVSSNRSKYPGKSGTRGIKIAIVKRPKTLR